MTTLEAITGTIGLAVMIHGYLLWLRLRARRPRLCACGHGSGMHRLEGGCRAYEADGSKRRCPCDLYDGQGPVVP